MNHFLNKLYKKHWIIDGAKPSTDHKHNVTYLGGYVKRPPIAESKLRHYDGHEVTFSYLDHTTKTRKKMTLTAEDFIGRFVQHIPDVNFRMIRYYGFLANRVRGKLLPLVHQLLGQKNEYRVLLDSLYADLGPQTVIENHLIEEMASVIWRKERLKKAEQAVYIEQDKESYSSHDVKQKLAKEYALLPLMRYEIHLDKKLERVLSVYYKLKELGSSPNHQT